MSNSSSGKGPTKASVVDFRSFGERPAKGLATSLYIGSKVDAKAEKALRERGVKFVLNCTPTRNLDPEAGCPNFFEGRAPPPFTYKRIPIFDNRGEDILQYMEGAIAFIEQSKHYGSVLVHCVKGVSRSASFVLGYLMKAGGMRLEEALAFLKERRAIVQPNDSFVAQLQTYDARLEAQRAEARAKHERHYGSASASASTTSGGGGAAAAATTATRPAAAAAASIGPALPPHSQKRPPQQQQQQQQQQEERKQGNGAPSAAIGPALPPHLQKGSGSASAAIGPALPPHLQKPSSPAGPSIGPSMPPAPQEQRPSTPGAGAEEKEKEKTKKRPAIGPALPPGLGAAAPAAAKGEGENGNEGEGKRAKNE